MFYECELESESEMASTVPSGVQENVLQCGPTLEEDQEGLEAHLLRVLFRGAFRSYTPFENTSQQSKIHHNSKAASGAQRRT